MTSTSEDTDDVKPGDRLYKHTKRAQWGYAVLAWERDGKRGYQFEDGELRVFKEGYYKLLAEAECPPDQAVRLLAQLGRASGAKGDGKGNDRVLTFDEQLAVFLEQYAEGFAGGEWRNQHRGEGLSRRLKRHRDAAIADAQEQLSREALSELIAANDHAEVVKRLSDVVQGTDLVTRAQADPLARAKPSADLSLGLRDLLYGEGPFDPLFDEFCRRLLEAGRKQLSWPLVTSILSLVQPNKHIAVRPTVIGKQAQWASPRLRYSAKPEARVYARILSMGNTVMTRLTEAGQPPKDFLDIYDFMLVTLRPAAERILEEVRARIELEGDAALSASALAQPQADAPAKGEAEASATGQNDDGGDDDKASAAAS